MYKQKKILQIASKELGQKEVRGPKENPRIRTYHKYATLKNKRESSENVPWCSSFMCFIAEKAGCKSTNSKLARSWERGGYKKKSRHPLPGDVVTFWRKSKRSGYGHVGIFLKQTKHFVYVMGGNQSDAVNIRRYSKERMTGIWRIHNEKHSIEMVEELLAMADSLIKHGDIRKGGRVT